MRFSDCNRNCQMVSWLVITLIGLAVVVSPLVPLGVPGEWTWTRHNLPADLAEWLDRITLPILGAALFLWIAFAGERWVSSGKRRALFAALPVLVCASFLLQFTLQQAAPSPHRELKPLWILYDKYASGYFYEAAFELNSAGSLLEGYEERMREGDVLHEGTHPPGLFLLNFAALQITKASPGLVRVLEAIRSADEIRIFRDLELQARMNRPLTSVELAALQLMVLLGITSNALIGIPVFLIVAALKRAGRGQTDRSAAWRSACLAATIPSLCIFSPRSDVIYPFTATLFLAFACSAVLAENRGLKILWAVCGSLTFFAGVLLSLAHLPALVLFATFAFLRGLLIHPRQLKALLIPLVAGILTFVSCVLLWQNFTDCNLLTVWQLNLKNHAGFYGTSPRSWWAWFLVNPLELALAVGVPLFAAAFCSVIRSALSAAHALTRPAAVPPEMQQRNVASFVLAAAATWSILWLSGKNMGEAARLWCFLTPWLAISAGTWLTAQAGNAALLSQPDNSGEERVFKTPDPLLWQLILVLQLLTSMITVGRVNGYSI